MLVLRYRRAECHEKKTKSKEQEGYENINELRMARYKRPEGRIPVGRQN